MDESKQPEAAPRFFGYPRAVEAPATPYRKKEDANPVFTGVLLLIGAWMSVSSTRLSRSQLTFIVFPKYSSSKEPCGRMRVSMAFEDFHI
tara:strand:- start:1314 stop:1583 length:270 start_codon:yes stop_codon:yes gene_type:complete